MVAQNEKKTWGSGGLIGNRTLGSLFLMLTCPLFLLSFWYTCAHHNGDFMGLYNEFQTKPYMEVLGRIWPTPFDPDAWKLIRNFMFFEAFLMKFVPGKKFTATVTPTGHVPTYKANGVQCYLITLVALFGLNHIGYFRPAQIYDKKGELLSALNVFSIFFCAFLSFKGLYFPSTKDSGTTGNIIVDYFWGTELYPNIFGWDVKQFTNCRFGMMYWQMGIICYAFKQYELNGSLSNSMIASVVLQSIYVFKFFYWETGYFCSMDIQHDRAGYYICWGCLCWVPSIYTIHTFFLVEHPIDLSIEVTLLIIVTGITCIWCNYDCDRQRQEFRQTNGKSKVWGKPPVFIEAKYVTEEGEKRTSLLLASGWWGLSRHIHYIPEIGAAICWCIPAMFNDGPLPYFYPFFLTILLFDRAYRDDLRCADKYKQYWEEYCKKVPSKIIPGII